MSTNTKLRFVTYTDCPAKQSKRDLKTVRSHVMHDYFSRQRPADDQDGSNKATRRTTATQPRRATSPNKRKASKTDAGQRRDQSVSFVPGVGPVGADVCQVHSLEPAFSIGCFQLERPKDVERRTPNATESSSDSGNSPRKHAPVRQGSEQSVGSMTSSRTASTASSVGTPPDADAQLPWVSQSCESGALKADTTTLHLPVISSEQHLAMTRAGPDPRVQLVPSKFDPFDQLPVNSRNMGELVPWHFQWPVTDYSNWEKQTPCLLVSTGFYKRSIWEMSQSSVGMFHLFLCLAEAKKAAVTGMSDNVNYYYHRGRAIQEMMAGVQEPKRIAPTALATLASAMAALSLNDDGPEVALVHMKAATGIINNRTGGLSAFPEGQFRAIAWGDMRIASGAFERPMLPYSPRAQWAQPPADLLDESHRLADLSCIMMPSVDLSSEADTMHCVFQKLHQTSLIFDHRGPVNPPLIASHLNGFYLAEYQLCCLVADFCRLEGRGTKARVRNFTPGAAMLLACQLFAWSCMPSQSALKIHMPPHSNVVEVRILSILLKGLREQSEGNLVEFWQKRSRLESLVWILILAQRNCRRTAFGGEDMSAWILEELESVGRALGYTTKSEYAEAFKCFPCIIRIGTPLWPGLGRDFAEWNPQLNRR